MKYTLHVCMYVCMHVCIYVCFCLPSESRKFKGSVTIQQLNEETNWTIPLPSYLDRTKSYLLYLSTKLTKVHLSPCELRVYPSEQEVKCAELADDVRSLVENNTQSLDKVNTQSLDQVRGLLIDMCDVIKEGRSYTTTTTSPPAISPLTTSPPAISPLTTSPPAISPLTASPPSIEPVNTTQDTTSAAEATPTTLSTTPTTSPAIPTSQGNNENPSTSEESTDTALLEVQDRAEDISVMLWVFFVFLALLILGVSGYLLFNHHAKVLRTKLVTVFHLNMLMSSWGGGGGGGVQVIYSWEGKYEHDIY